MDDFNYLEEPPPIQRAVPVATRRKTGLFAPKVDRPSAPPPASRDSGTVAHAAAPAQSPSGTGILLGVAALVVLLVQGFLLHGARSDVAELRTRVDQAQKSIGQIWENSKGMDQDRMERLALLADSIRSVFDYTQGEVRLWTARLDENDRNMATRLDEFARVQLARVDAIERQSRTYSSAFEALARRAEVQERSARDFGTTIATLRASLGRLDSELSALEQRNAASTLAVGQLSRRIEGFTNWADGFRQAGLSSDFVLGRLSAHSDELRRLRMRVDSLRPTNRTAVSDQR